MFSGFILKFHLNKNIFILLINVIQVTDLDCHFL